MNETINETLNQTLNVTGQEALNQSATLFGYTAPFTTSPTLDIYLLTLVVSLFITLTNKYMTDQVKIKALRKEMKDLQKKVREAMTKDPKKAQKMQQDMMKKNMENMKHTMNPKIMLITMVPLMIVFSFVGKLYSDFGEFFNFLGMTEFGWLGTYIVFSIVNSILMKKILNVA